MVTDELDMLFLLEHFSLEDLVKAEEEYNTLCDNSIEAIVDRSNMLDEIDSEIEEEAYANATSEDLGYYVDGDYYLFD